MIKFQPAITTFILTATINCCLAQPVITSFKVSGKETPLSSTIQLTEENNSFSFDYVLPNSSIPVRYTYTLQGFDKYWIDAGSRTYTNYTNLPGGNYTFKLKASTDSVNWTEIVSPPLINISTAFYKSAWFIVLLAIAIFSAAALVIYFAQRVQLQQILMKEKIRNNIASDLHDDIGSSLSSIIIMGEVAKRQPAETANYLTQITETARQVIENMKDIVWAINPENDNMEQMMIRMQRFACGLLEKKNIMLHFDAMPETENMKLGMEERKNFYLIFKETIHNAFKYAECSNVTVQLKNNGNTITMKIEDNGKGFDTSKKYMGNGLYNLQKRTTDINGMLEISSVIGSGTSTMLAFKTTQTGG